MSRLYASTVRWWPVIAMIAVYGAIAYLTAFFTNSDGLTREKMKDWFWLDYLRLWGFPLLQALIAIRAFFDKTLSQHVEKLGRSSPNEGNQ